MPVFLIGLIPLGILLYRIGDEWNNRNIELEKNTNDLYNDAELLR